MLYMKNKANKMGMIVHAPTEAIYLPVYIPTVVYTSDYT